MAKLNSDWWATFLALFSALGAFLFGLDVGYIAPILDCPSFKRDVARLPNWSDPQSNINSTTVGMIVGIFSLGCVLAALPPCSAMFLDVWGRRASITFGTGVFLVGCGIQAGALSVEQFMAGRFIAGFSIGLLSTVVALYQSELAPPARRGALVSLYQLMIALGILVAAGLDYGLVMKDHGWRIAIGLQAIPAMFLLVGTSFMPRSPRWLVQQGRTEEALQVLYTLRADDGEAAAELQEIIDNVEAAKAQGEPRWGELCKGKLGLMLMTGLSLQLLQQFCGMNAFMYFGPRIYKQANLDPLLFQTLNAGSNVLFTLPGVFLIDKYGRRPLLACSGVGMMVCCLVMGSVGLMQAGGAGHSASMVVVAMSFGFVANFAYGWGPVVWTYCAEMFPLKHRARCVGLTTTANWLGNYVIAQFTPIMLDKMGFSAFFVFGMFCFLCVLLALWVPETKGIVLERIEGLFDEKFSALGSGGKDSLEKLITADSRLTTADTYGATGRPEQAVL